MLKIKDNVDLKELEKFGFKKDNVAYLYEYIITILDETFIGGTWCNCDEVVVLAVDDERKIKISDEDLVADILFDLIQAGLVEKVKGEAL